MNTSIKYLMLIIFPLLFGIASNESNEIDVKNIDSLVTYTLKSPDAGLLSEPCGSSPTCSQSCSHESIWMLVFHIGNSTIYMP